MSSRIIETNLSRQSRLSKPAASSAGGVVSSQHRRASEIGVEVLRAGGNAYDAAVAVSFAMGVLEPWMSGPFGGGAMMVAPADGPVEALYYGMRAPAQLRPEDYPLEDGGRNPVPSPWRAVKDDRNVRGALAVAVPGTVAGIAALHERYGRMPWKELLAPAISEARKGMLVDWYAGLIIASQARVLAQDQDAAGLFLEDGVWPRMPGLNALSETRLNMDRMADTLTRLAEAGAGDFYRGDLALNLVTDLRDKGSRIVMEDLETYQAQWQKPLSIVHRESTIHATPRLTSGPALAEMLACLRISRPEIAKGIPGAADYAAWADALRTAYQNRLSSAGDIETAEAGSDAPNAPACTTHFAIVDRDGNMLSMTQTLLSGFGAGVVSPSTGLLMNNGIMWFNPEQGKPNSVGPGKRCLMNICPVIVDTLGSRMALGAAGGRKILPAVAQITLMVADHGLDLEQAMHLPRIDVSGGPDIQANPGLPASVIEALGKRFDVNIVGQSHFTLTYACPVAVSRKDGVNQGVCEIAMPWAEAVAEH